MWLQNDSLVFFQGSTQAEALPPALRLSRYERQVDLPITVYTAANMCVPSTGGWGMGSRRVLVGLCVGPAQG